MTIEEIIEELPLVNSDRNYWFVRTQGGQYYQDFFENGFIAIGYDKIGLTEIDKVSKGKYLESVPALADKVAKSYKDEVRPNHAAGQLIKFTFGIKRGDIVLIPSFSSNAISFGEVTKTDPYEEKRIKEVPEICPFFKRKKVHWLKTVQRDDLDPYLYRLMYSHHTISEGDFYSEYIDKVINSFFIKDEVAHLILDVQTTVAIPAKDLFEMGTVALSLLGEFRQEEKDIKFNLEDVDVKMNLQSPGTVELAGSIVAITILGIIFIAVAGGEFKIKYKNDLSVGIKTQGIIEKVASFLQSRRDIKNQADILAKHTKGLNIENPQDLIKIIEAITKKKK